MAKDTVVTEGAEGLSIRGVVLARKRLADPETGEVKGYRYRLLAGVDVFEVTQWGLAEPAPLGSVACWPVMVRAYARKG